METLTTAFVLLTGLLLLTGLAGTASLYLREAYVTDRLIQRTVYYLEEGKALYRRDNTVLSALPGNMQEQNYHFDRQVEQVHIEGIPLHRLSVTGFYGEKEKIELATYLYNGPNGTG